MNAQPIHLEIVYKFYLYAPEIGKDIHAWIGPNKKDSLIEKLNRLNNHQLPLLYQPECIKFLKSRNIAVEDVIQRVLFKAQLFIPDGIEAFDFENLNEACVAGWYLHFSLFDKFRDCKCYLPHKYDWLVEPHTNVGWLSFETVVPKVQAFIETQFSPMLWIKHPNGVLQKYFIIWWS